MIYGFKPAQTGEYTLTFTVKYENPGSKAAVLTRNISVSGVDEDEEGSDMIVFQNMLFNQYKMLNVLNEVLDKLINETGV